MTKTKELQEVLIDNMQRWQKIESGSIAMTSTIMSKTDNAVIKLIMEIIKRDSEMHHRIQQLIIDSLQKESISLTPEELGKVWDLIERHIKMEEDTVRLAKEAKEKAGWSYEYRVIDKKYGDLPTDILVWDDKVAVMALESPIFATVTTNQALADTYRVQFEIMWSALK